jgi:integrase
MTAKTPKPQRKASKGTVTAKNSNGRLQLVFRHPATGKQVYISTGLPYTPVNVRGQLASPGKDIEKALAWGTIDTWLADYKAKKTPTASTKAITLKLSLSQLWESYTAHKTEVGSKGKPLSESTLKRDYGKIEKRIAALPSKLDDPSKAEDIKAHWKAKYSDEILRRMLMQVNACCEWAVKAEFLEINLFKEMDRPAKQHRSDNDSYKAFSAEERLAIIEAFETNKYSSKFASVSHSHYTPYVKLMFKFGFRPEELVALTWGDIDNEFKTITINKARPCDTGIKGNTKTNKARKINFNPQQSDFLKNLKPTNASKNDLIVSGVEGGYLDYHNFSNRIWKPLLGNLVKNGKIDKYLPQYHMRHTAISEALKAGISVTDVARMVGNSPEIIYKHYASANKEAMMPEI